MKIKITLPREVEVAFLQAECGVRYWEDATVNGEEDHDGSRIPCREGDAWTPTICLETGKIEGWPEGTTAKIHYKVCDEGIYTLLDADRTPAIKIDGYVPAIMSPSENGYGDYVIMTVGADGVIENWTADLTRFEEIGEPA